VTLPLGIVTNDDWGANDARERIDDGMRPATGEKRKATGERRRYVGGTIDFIARRARARDDRRSG